MIPQKTYMPYISAFVYLVCFTAKYAAVRSFSWHYSLPRSLQCVVLFSVSLKQFYFQYIANDDIIQVDDKVNIPCIFIQGNYYLGKYVLKRFLNCLNWLEKTIVSEHIFCQFLVSYSS